MTAKADVTPAEKAENEASANHGSPWKRLLYLVMFAVVFNIVEIVIFVIVIVQFISQVASGKANSRLRLLGRSLADYARQIIEFMTYSSDRMPFPFARWPNPSQPPKWPF